MGIEDYKITGFKKPVSALSDTPQMSADELKEWFDSNSTDELKNSVNGIIDCVQEGLYDACAAIDTKVDKVSGKGLSANDYTDAEKAKLSGIADGANNYIHPATHSADMIEESADKRFTNDAELNTKVDKVSGKGLSTNDYTDAEKAKLSGIADGANNYVHPAMHSADMITETELRGFISAAERVKIHEHTNKALLDTITEDKLNSLPHITWNDMDTFDGQAAVVTREVETSSTGTSGKHYTYTYLLLQYSQYPSYDGHQDNWGTVSQMLISTDGDLVKKRTRSEPHGSWGEWIAISDDAIGQSSDSDGSEIFNLYQDKTVNGTVYTKNTAGIYAHAEGVGTTASGDFAHSEGKKTTASGGDAHAEGSGTVASGKSSHAEGGGSKAMGAQSHAEGNNTTARGARGHAEGYGTVVDTNGNAAHAEGYETAVNGFGAHSEGYQTEATADYSHAEGAHTVASKNTAHAEGVSTTADGYASHAEGNSTITKADFAHAEGDTTIAGRVLTEDEASEYTASDPVNVGTSGGGSGGTGNTGEGQATQDGYEGNSAHAEGSHTNASAMAAHAEGRYTRATGMMSHAEGYKTQANENSAHAEGYATIANGIAAHAEGRDAEASGEYSHAEGYHTKAAGANQHVEGKYNAVDNESKYIHIAGNGVGEWERSNAHTLDWHGNAWYAGDVEASHITLRSATPGSSKKIVLSADDNGIIGCGSDVIEIGANNGVNKISAAIAAAPNNVPTVIRLRRDPIATSVNIDNTITVPANKDIILDFTEVGSVNITQTMLSVAASNVLLIGLEACLSDVGGISIIEHTARGNISLCDCTITSTNEGYGGKWIIRTTANGNGVSNIDIKDCKVSDYHGILLGLSDGWNVSINNSDIRCIYGTILDRSITGAGTFSAYNSYLKGTIGAFYTINGASAITLRGCTIYNNDGGGVIIGNGIIQGCRFEGSGNAIYVSKPNTGHPKVIITHNVINQAIDGTPDVEGCNVIIN